MLKDLPPGRLADIHHRGPAETLRADLLLRLSRSRYLAGLTRPPPVARAAARAASIASSAITAARRSGGRTVQIRGSGATVRPAPGRIRLTCRR